MFLKKKLFVYMSYQRCTAFQWDLQNISIISRCLNTWSKNCPNLSSAPCIWLRYPISIVDPQWFQSVSRPGIFWSDSDLDPAF
jgi:hypothetical protein